MHFLCSLHSYIQVYVCIYGSLCLRLRVNVNVQSRVAHQEDECDVSRIRMQVYLRHASSSGVYTDTPDIHKCVSASLDMCVWSHPHATVWRFSSSFCSSRHSLLLTVLFLFLLFSSPLPLLLFRYEAKYVVPMVNATLIASGSVGGILLFEEYAHMASTSIYAFACGSFLVVMGILVLTTAASGAVSKAAQPEYIAKRIRELGCDGTEDER